MAIKYYDSLNVTGTTDSYFLGDVGIGTSTPGEKLEVNGNIKVIKSGETPDVSVFHSDGNYAKLRGQGLFLSRATSYLAPEQDNFGSLAVGYNGTRWGNVEINAATVKFENGSNEFMRITSSGNVGIGTTSPVQKFHVHGGNINIQNGDGAYLTFNNGDANIVANYNESGRDLSFKTYNGTALAEKMRIDKDGALKLNTYTAGTLVSDASGNITVSSGGGTGGPYLPLAGGTMTGTSGVLMPDNFKLNFGNAPDFEIYHNSTTNVNHISSLLGRQLAISSDTTIFSGDVLVEDNLYLTDAGAVRGKIQLNSSDRDDVDIKAVSLGSNMKFFTVDAERMRINSSGNVGIGTTSPGAKLQIGSATYAPNANLGNNLLQIKSPSGYAYLTIGNGDSANATSYIGGASGFTVIGSVTDAGALSEHARITNTGNVGIGTTSPGATLQIGAGIANVSQKIHGGSTAGIQIFTGGGSGTKIAALEQYFSNEGSLQLHLSGTSKIRLRANGDSFLNGGNVGIGTASPSEKLDVNGTVNLTNLKIATAQGTDGQVLTSTGSGIAWEDAGGGSGTVTSIAAGTGLTGGTITTSGTIALDYSGNNNFILSSGTQLTSAADDDVLAIVDVGGSREVKYIEKEDFLEDQVTSVITGEPNGSDSIINIVSLTQAEYDAGTPVATTLYIIT
jgi:hypothetical protein